MNRVDSGAFPTPGDDPSAGGGIADDDAMLLTFVSNRDAPCPACGYNLRNLTKPVCPECRQRLRLAVGLSRLRLGGLLATIAPGIFSGIAAGIIIAVLFVALLTTRGAVGGPPWEFYGLVGFGIASGLVALAVIRWRNRFLRLAPAIQWVAAAILWAVHLTAFALLLLLAR